MKKPRKTGKIWKRGQSPGTLVKYTTPDGGTLEVGKKEERMAQIKFDVIKAIREWHEEIVAEIREILEDTVGNETEQELAEQIFERLLNAELLRTPEDPKPDLGPLARGGFYHPTEREAI